MVVPQGAVLPHHRQVCDAKGGRCGLLRVKPSGARGAILDGVLGQSDPSIEAVRLGRETRDGEAVRTKSVFGVA
jgi:hypothetical protein